MIRPVADESKLAHIENLEWESLKEQFRKQVSHFTNSVHKRLRPKAIAGKHLNGGMLLTLALEYTEALNNKETPTVMTALDRVVHAETVKVIDGAFEEWKEELESELNEEKLPVTEKELNKITRGLTSKHKLAM